MHALRTAILLHNAPDGPHHDWLIEDPRLQDPTAPQARLWTARVGPAPEHWHTLGRLDLQLIAPHRRAYLAYQGAVSGRRGRVQRVAQGMCLPLLWSAGRVVLDVHTDRFSGRVDMRLLNGGDWLATVGA